MSQICITMSHNIGRQPNSAKSHFMALTSQTYIISSNLNLRIALKLLHTILSFRILRKSAKRLTVRKPEGSMPTLQITTYS